jgi:nucleoside-triphosphatase
VYRLRLGGPLTMSSVARVLITGPPGVGKTTLTLRVIDLLRERGEQLAGFTTSDVRRGGRRTGFVITGIGGLERTLAVTGGAGPRVGSYGVDVEAFEEVALLELENGLELGTTLVIDEIGKMELLSRRFQALLPAIFEAPRLLATVLQRRHPLMDAYKDRADVRLITIGPHNRGEIAGTIADLVLSDVYSSR